MSNSWKSIFTVPSAAAAGYPVETAAADLFTWIIEHPIRVTDVELVVSVLVASDTQGSVVALDGTIAGHPNGSTRQELGTVTLVEGDAVGSTRSMVDEDTTWVTADFSKGDTLFVQMVTAATDSGTVAGDFHINIYYELVPDGKI